MEMGYADWVVAKYLANYSIRWIAEQTGTAQAMVKATLFNDGACQTRCCGA